VKRPGRRSAKRPDCLNTPRRAAIREIAVDIGVAGHLKLAVRD
jgi:hypothetical protein